MITRPRPGCLACPLPFQIQLSDSPVQTATLIQTCVIAPVVWSARGAPSFPFPHRREGAERRKALATLGTFAKAPACRVTGTHASRRSTGGVSPLGTALPGAGQTSLTSPRSRRHSRRPSVRPRPAIEGSSHLAMGTGGGPRRPGRCLRKHSDPGATPCSAK
jgi:hypothetical protein